MMAVMERTAQNRMKPRADGYWLIAGPHGGPVGHVHLTGSAAGIVGVELFLETLPLQPRSDQPAVRQNHSFLTRHPWAEDLIAALQDYLQGKVVSFDAFPVDLSHQPLFRRRVLEECRRIPYGQTITYAELAARAGNAGAIRAAASAMSHNPIPLIIPCHRVLRSDGGLGGYSAPGGVALKAQLLEMEKKAVRVG